MPLELLPMEERDLEVYEEIAWAAFKDDLMGIMYPNGYTQAAKDWWIKYALQDWREQPEKYKFLKVVDTELPEDDENQKIVGVAMWKFYPKDRTEEELQAEEKKSEMRGAPADSNQELIEEFFGNIAKYKRRIMGGRAHVLLNLLATHPQHHRRGVGAMHLRWGAEHADRLGLPCYLEASPMGKPLYMREGYEVKHATILSPSLTSPHAVSAKRKSSGMAELRLVRPRLDALFGNGDFATQYLIPTNRSLPGVDIPKSTTTKSVSERARAVQKTLRQRKKAAMATGANRTPLIDPTADTATGGMEGPARPKTTTQANRKKGTGKSKPWTGFPLLDVLYSMTKCIL